MRRVIVSTRNRLPLRIDTSLLQVAILCIYILAIATALTEAKAYAPSADHGAYGCHICHGGLEYKTMTRETGDFVFTEFRCIECHYQITGAAVEALRYTKHRDIGCTCHSTLHVGHTGWGGGYYYTSRTGYLGYAGCSYDSWRSGGCHNIVSTRVNGAEEAQGILYPLSFEKFDIEVNQNTTKSTMLDTHYDFSPNTVATRGVYAIAFVDPFDIDNIEGVPTGREYLMCMYCHMNHYDPLSAPYSQQDYPLIHPDNCLDCHSDPLISDTLPHAIRDAKYSWQTCSGASGVNSTLSCHGTTTPDILNYVSNSVHASIGCRCHPVVHISRWNGTASWMFIYTPRGTYAKPDVGTLLLSGRLTWFYDAGNSSAYYVPVNEVNNTAAGYTSYLVMIYADRMGDASYMVNNTAIRYLMCLNCHFVVDNPSALGAYTEARELGLIPIPRNVFEDLKDPHNVTRLLLRSGGGAAENTSSIESWRLLIIVGSVLGLVVVAMAGVKRR